METTMYTEEFRKLDQEIKEVIYGCFRRFQFIIFPGAKSKLVAQAVCNHIAEKLHSDNQLKQDAYFALIAPVTHLVRRQIHPGWLIRRKPFFIGAIHREITGYLISSGIIKTYHPPES